MLNNVIVKIVTNLDGLSTVLSSHWNSYLNASQTQIQISFIGTMHCCFHTGDGSHDPPLSLFKPDILLKCHEVLKIRKQQNLRYQESYLSNILDDIHGYHVDCYRRFTVYSCFAMSQNQHLTCLVGPWRHYLHYEHSDT